MPSALRGVVLCVAMLLSSALPAAAAQPFIWDQDGNGKDDRIESVQIAGYAMSFEMSDTTLRQRIQVERVPGGLVFGVYVLWEQPPTTSDLLALAALGMSTLSRIEAIPATRSLATFAQISAAATLPGVERIEAVPVLYSEIRDGVATVGVRDVSELVFPTWASALPAAEGQGVVVAFLDTGVNDAPDGAYPGHQSLLGRCLGGAVFLTPDSLGHTPRSGSVNPMDRGGEATQSHGTHVASIAVGSGSESGYARGVAPQAKFIDVKVLDDSGHGVAVPEAIDWCIANRSRHWDGATAQEYGIDVINLSLSSPDASDGQDLAARLAARAAELGIVVVASSGNDGANGHVPSPAGGDGVLVVGAWDTKRSATGSDDAWAPFSNRGPRASDGDGDARDECKPDVLAPGVDVLSADGSLASDGTTWHRLSGTSMAAAFVSGAAALLIESAPGTAASDIADLIRSSASRPLPGAPAGATGADPRWNSSRGCGLLDVHAALLEAAQPGRSQVRRLTLSATPTAVLATLTTARERGASHFVFERAEDVAGAPGTFAPYDSVSAAGDSSLADGTSARDYPRSWLVPLPEAGVAFWYRIAYSEAGVRWVTPSRRFVSPGGPSVCTLEATIVHNAYDAEVEADIRAGFAGKGGPVFALPGTGGAVSSDWVDGASLTGNQAWSFRIEVPQGAANAYMPPDPAHPWVLRALDTGTALRTGRITDFRLTWHSGGGDIVYVGGPVPTSTVDGTAVEVSIPAPSLGVGPVMPGAALRLGPSPVRAGGSVRFTAPSSSGSRVSIHDLQGREVAAFAMRREGEGWVGEWHARDAAGGVLAPGVYLTRVGDQAGARLVVLTR